LQSLDGILDAAKARAIYEAGYSTIYHVSKAKPVQIMKALQKTMATRRQFSEDLSEIFLQSGVEKTYATLAQAEQIVCAAKKIRKRQRKVI